MRQLEKRKTKDFAGDLSLLRQQSAPPPPPACPPLPCSGVTARSGEDSGMEREWVHHDYTEPVAHLQKLDAQAEPLEVCAREPMPASHCMQRERAKEGGRERAKGQA